MGDKTIEAPFTDEQVESLNGYQMSGAFHPFTCTWCRDHRDVGSNDDCLLVATRSGWICPTCTHHQTWAWVWMGDNEWKHLFAATSGLEPE